MSLVTNDWKDGITFTGATTGTVGPFTVLGGKYVFYATAAGTSVVLNILMPDGSTYSPAYSETTSAFFQMIDLPPGTYEVVVTTSTAVQGGVIKVPYNPAY